MTPPPPGWVVGQEAFKGLDILGLRTPVQRVGDYALDGIVTVTPQVRYLGFYAWILRSYWRQRRPDARARLRDYISRSTFCLVLANLLEDPTTTGLLGSTEAERLLSSEGEGFEFRALVQNDVGAVYGGVIERLGLTLQAEGGAIPHLVQGRGDALAEAVAQALESTALGRQMAAEGPPEWVSREALLELGRAGRVGMPSPQEQEVLLGVILPEAPLPGEERRLASYALLLTLARELGRPPDEGDFFRRVVSPEPLPAYLEPARALWGFYLTRDSLSVLHERAVAVILLRLRQRQGFGEARGIIADILASQDQWDTLSALGLPLPIEGGHGLETLTCQDLWEALEEGTADAEEREGRLSWGGALNEWELIHRGQGGDEGVAVLLVVAWMMALRRNAPALGELGTPSLGAARAGMARLGLVEVILPQVMEWRHSGTSLLEAAAQLLYRSVDQHLRTVWSRRGREPHRDASRLIVDGPLWRYRGDFDGGRSLNPIGLACGWLRTLNLLGDEGLTPGGERTLARIERQLGEVS